MHLTRVVRVHATLPVNCTVAGLHTKCSPGGSFGLRCESGNIYIYMYVVTYIYVYIYIYIYVPLSHLRSKESQCIYITYCTGSKC